MKTFTSLLALLILSFSVCGQQYKNLDSKISEVSLFPDRAQVSRLASVELTAGESLLRITGLSPYIDASSIQVSGEGDFMIVSVNSRMNYLEETVESDEVKTLRSRIESLKTKIEDERTGIEILREKEAFLTANRVVTGKNESISAQELKSISDFYTSTIESVRKGILEKNRLIEKYEKEKQKLENQLNGAVKKSNTPSSEVLIAVSAGKTGSARISLSYLVSNAGWYPSYDIRVDDINQDVNIFYKANVWQRTGIEWKNAILSFSSASPTTSGNVPDLLPYYLNFYTPISTTRSKARSMAQPQAMEEVMIVLDEEDSGYDAASPPVNIIERGTAVSFEVNMPQNIKPDGKTNTIELQRLTSKTMYKYVSVPKLREEAFLTADIPDWELLNLMNGEANIYFGNTFTGTSMINTGQISDTLSISLGIDKNIIVERKVRKENTIIRTIGSKRTETRSYTISVRNNKSQDIDIVVYDQVPVSQNKDIEVEVEEISNGVLNDFSGELKWINTIPSQQTKEYVLTYTVKYPKNRKVVLD